MITEKNCLLQVILDLQSMMMPMGGSKEQTVSMVWDSGMKEQDSIIVYHDTHKDKQFQFSSVQSLSCVQLFAIPWTVSTPGLLVHHQLLEFTQTYVHRVGDAIQPSHLLPASSLPAFNLSQHQGLFQ